MGLPCTPVQIQQHPATSHGGQERVLKGDWLQMEVPKFGYLWSNEIALACSHNFSICPHSHQESLIVLSLLVLLNVTGFLKWDGKGQSHRGYKASALISRPCGSAYGHNTSGNGYHRFLSCEPINWDWNYSFRAWLKVQKSQKIISIGITRLQCSQGHSVEQSKTVLQVFSVF